MARTTSQPSTANGRSTTKTQSDTSGLGARGQQDQRAEGGKPDNNGRREGLSAVREEQVGDRRAERESGKSREDTQEGSRSEQWSAAVATGTDIFAPMLEAWKQVFKSWSELAETTVKVQQDAFARMFTEATGKKLDVGESRDSEHAMTGSRTTVSSEKADRDRR